MIVFLYYKRYIFDINTVVGGGGVVLTISSFVDLYSCMY